MIMKKKLLCGLFYLSLVFAFSAGNCLAEDAAEYPYGIMIVDEIFKAEMEMDHELALPALIDEKLAEKIPPQGSWSLLSHVTYTPSERNQASCGNCWLWGGTGVMEIALSVQNGIKSRLSIQYGNSCKTGNYACCGGWLADVASFYSSTKKAIPWSNGNASWQDGDNSCSTGAPDVVCGAISTVPNFPITNISHVAISTHGDSSEATKIANIKNVLHQNKGVWFAFFLPDDYSWNQFFSFWDNQPETAIFNYDFANGRPWVSNQGGGHAVLCVGYNDNDANPANHYWIMLNSWGSRSNRPNGLFRVKMHMNYNNKDASGSYNIYWQTLNMTYNVVASHQDEIIGTWDGIWYRNLANNSWVQTYTAVPNGPISAGDVDNDGKDEIITCWASGLWYQHADTKGWVQVYSLAPSKVAGGDVTGDGRDDIIGTWSDGIWYRNLANNTWVKTYGAVPNGPIAAGDVDKDGKDEIVTCWTSGLWYQHADTKGWVQVYSSAPSKVAAGDVTGPTGAAEYGATDERAPE
jgi:hypothetical protein